MIAALYVAPRGIYFGRPDVDPWPADRDARTYPGPWPVVAHPPCERWGRWWWADGSTKPGDDGGCFEAALASVERWGGILEHPAGSLAWARFRLPEPPLTGGWVRSMFRPGWACHVEQGHYGHRAKKPTWLYYVGDNPPQMMWGPGPDVLAERAAASKGRQSSTTIMSRQERKATPTAFADVLIEAAHGVGDHRCRVFDPDSDCPQCQIVWAEMVESMVRPGANVLVQLPPDVAPWYDEEAFGASWVGDVYQANGDSLDVFNPNGDVEPVDIATCRPWRAGTYTVPGAA